MNSQRNDINVTLSLDQLTPDVTGYRKLSIENSPVLQQTSKSLKTQIITTEMKPVQQSKLVTNERKDRVKLAQLELSNVLEKALHAAAEIMGPLNFRLPVNFTQRIYIIDIEEKVMSTEDDKAYYQQLSIENAPGLQQSCTSLKTHIIMTKPKSVQQLVTSGQNRRVEFIQLELSNILDNTLRSVAIRNPLKLILPEIFPQQIYINDIEEISHGKIMSMEDDKTYYQQMSIENAPGLQQSCTSLKTHIIMTKPKSVQQLVTSEQNHRVEFIQLELSNILDNTLRSSAKRNLLKLILPEIFTQQNYISDIEVISHGKIMSTEDDKTYYQQLSIENAPGLQQSCTSLKTHIIMTKPKSVQQLVTSEQNHRVEFIQLELSNILDNTLRSVAIRNPLKLILPEIFTQQNYISDIEVISHGKIMSTEDDKTYYQQLSIENAPGLQQSCTSLKTHIIMTKPNSVQQLVTSGQKHRVEFIQLELSNILDNTLRSSAKRNLLKLILPEIFTQQNYISDIEVISHGKIMSTEDDKTYYQQLSIENAPGLQQSCTSLKTHIIMTKAKSVQQLVTNKNNYRIEFTELELSSMLDKVLRMVLAVEKSLTPKRKHDLPLLANRRHNLVKFPKINQLELSNMLNKVLRMVTAIEKLLAPKRKHGLPLVTNRRKNLVDLPKIELSDILKQPLPVSTAIEIPLNSVIPVNYTQQYYNGDVEEKSYQKIMTTEANMTHHQQLIIENEPDVQQPSTIFETRIVMMNTKSVMQLVTNGQNPQVEITQLEFELSDLLKRALWEAAAIERSLNLVLPLNFTHHQRLSVENEPGVQQPSTILETRIVMTNTKSVMQLVTNGQNPQVEITQLEFELSDLLKRALWETAAIERSLNLVLPLNFTHHQRLSVENEPGVQQLSTILETRIVMTNTKSVMQLVTNGQNPQVEITQLEFELSDLLKRALREAAAIERSLNLVLPLNYTHHQRLSAENEHGVQQPFREIRFPLATTRTMISSWQFYWNMRCGTTRPAITEVISSESIVRQEDLDLQVPGSGNVHRISFLSALWRRFIKVGRLFCCWHSNTTLEEE